MTFLLLDSISGGEILVILLIVLMVFGADSIPKIARTFGRTIRQFKDATQEIQRDIQESAKISTKDFTDVRKGIEESLENTSKEVRNIGKDIEDSVEK